MVEYTVNNESKIFEMINSYPYQNIGYHILSDYYNQNFEKFIGNCGFCIIN